jgi:hypothetical protein
MSAARAAAGDSVKWPEVKPVVLQEEAARSSGGAAN